MALNLLLIEDSPDDAELVTSSLGGLDFEIEIAVSLAAGVGLLQEKAYDAILLDLGLPDSQGLDTLQAVQRAAADAPIVILSGSADESRAVKSVQMGAQDYLLKDDICRQALSRAVRYAVERQRLRADRTAAQLRLDMEAESLSRLAEFGSLKSMGSTSIRESAHKRFERMVCRYMGLFTQAEEMRIFKVTHPMSKILREIAKELAELRASPRDVVELHAEAVRRRTKSLNASHAALIHEEGRLMALELMGYLASFYREYALGQPPVYD